MKQFKFRTKLFTSPTPPNPYPYLKDFGKIESYGFGFWRPFAIIIWASIFLLFGFATWLCMDMMDLGINVFVRATFQFMTNVGMDYTQSVINIPLVQPACAISLALCVYAFFKLCWTLNARPISKIYKMSDTEIA